MVCAQKWAACRRQAALRSPSCPLVGVRYPKVSSRKSRCPKTPRRCLRLVPRQWYFHVRPSGLRCERSPSRFWDACCREWIARTSQIKGALDRHPNARGGRAIERWTTCDFERDQRCQAQSHSPLEMMAEEHGASLLDFGAKG